MINSDILKDFLQARNWAACHGMLDDARQNAVSADEIRSEIGWRLFVLKQQQRYDEALALLYDKQSAFDCRSYVKAQFSRLFTLLGRDEVGRAARCAF